MISYLRPEEADQVLATMTPEEKEQLSKEMDATVKLTKKLILELMDRDRRFSALITAVTGSYAKVISSGVSPRTFGQCLFEAMNYYAENLHDKEAS